MSYCRWSSMNWKCDVYVYEDVSGGWTTHVAGRRRMFHPIPDILDGKLSIKIVNWADAKWNKETRKFVYSSAIKQTACKTYFWFAAFWHNHVHMASVRLIPLRTIGLPFDGETFNDPTPVDCAERLEWLRKLGYIVPQYAIDNLRNEILEPNN